MTPFLTTFLSIIFAMVFLSIIALAYPTALARSYNKVKGFVRGLRPSRYDRQRVGVKAKKEERIKSSENVSTLHGVSAMQPVGKKELNKSQKISDCFDSKVDMVYVSLCEVDVEADKVAADALKKETTENRLRLKQNISNVIGEHEDGKPPVLTDSQIESLCNLCLNAAIMPNSIYGCLKSLSNQGRVILPKNTADNVDSKIKNRLKTRIQSQEFLMKQCYLSFVEHFILAKIQLRHLIIISVIYPFCLGGFTKKTSLARF